MRRVADPQCGNVDDDVTSTASQVRNADAKGENVTEGLSPLTNTEQTLAAHI